MKVIHTRNLKRRELVGIKGSGKQSLVFRAGNSKYGYTNSRQQGYDFEPSGYANLDAAPEDVVAGLDKAQAEVEAMRREADALDDKIRARREEMRRIVKNLPSVKVEELPKLKPAAIQREENPFQEMRDSGADYIPYGDTLFVLEPARGEEEAA